MKFYFAPMEGITGYIYRNAHHEFFEGIDKYYTPFVVANQTYHFKTREKKDIAPENNKGLYVVPQIMSNKVDEFLWAAQELENRGYEEINLNLGCPAATVVSKGKGSGFLAYPDKLDAFLDAIYNGLEGKNIKLSIKTRLGKESIDEAGQLMEIYNQYPMNELIIHPRVQKDFYKNQPRMEAFIAAAEVSKHPVCYNGNLFSMKDYETFRKTCPNIKAVMLGRGLIAYPGLVKEIITGESVSADDVIKFHNVVLSEYQKVDGGEKNTLFKMKEIWAYMGKTFSEGEHYLKKIRKASHITDYEIAVRNLFANCRQDAWYC